MKVLTIRQPWAHLIMHGGKDIENREWPTNIRGRVAIHSSARLLMDEYCNAEDEFGGPDFPKPNDLVLGSILGTVEIVDCVVSSESPWFFGRFGFVLRNPIPFENPVPAKGALGFWEWNEVAA